jgi:hypothetical protein
MEVTPVGMFMEVKLRQLKNASFPIELTPDGMFIEVKLLQSANA